MLWLVQDFHVWAGQNCLRISAFTVCVNWLVSIFLKLETVECKIVITVFPIFLLSFSRKFFYWCRQTTLERPTAINDDFVLKTRVQWWHIVWWTCSGLNRLSLSPPMPMKTSLAFNTIFQKIIQKVLFLLLKVWISRFVFKRMSDTIICRKRN